MTRSAVASPPVSPSSMRIPGSWNREAHRLYLAGRLEEAVNLALRDAGMHVERFVQAMYYVYMHGDYRAGLVFCREYLKRRPGDVEMLNNACACCTKLGKYREAVGYAESVLAVDPDNADACDILAHAYGRLQDMTKAREAGTRALVLKDRAVSKASAETSLHQPAGTEVFLREARQKKSVCAFSLFGASPRYLRGALYNVLVAKELYPGWVMRFYLDETVPEDFRRLLRGLDAEVVEQDAGASRDRKLCWRFLVASDPEVGRFAVRDCDSGFSLREAVVVGEWLASGRLFHVIRDWYTHTDLMLAGLWGGYAGVLPDMQSLLDRFFADNRTLTPNIDQLFLGRCVWPAARSSCLVHDRFFDAFEPRRPPMQFFRTRNDHMGSDRSVVDRAWQDKVLAAWAEQCPCLRWP